MKILIKMGLFGLTLFCSILVMIYGWGLEPKSWGWIIGFGSISYLVIGILEYITD